MRRPRRRRPDFLEMKLKRPRFGGGRAVFCHPFDNPERLGRSEQPAALVREHVDTARLVIDLDFRPNRQFDLEHAAGIASRPLASALFS